jgi:hypothetical protein
VLIVGIVLERHSINTIERTGKYSVEILTGTDFPATTALVAASKMEIFRGRTCMKLMKTLGLAVLACAAAFAADTVSGTLIDQSCKAKDPVKHTRQCALGCAKSGFGVVTADGKFLKFDEKGNEKALAVLKASTKEADLKAKVTGELHGDMIDVESIELQ